MHGDDDSGRTVAPVPTTGSLSAKIIRACRVHKECPLECPDREVEDKGEIASFDNRPLIQKLREKLPWRR